MYDFDTPTPRAGSGAIKWDMRDKLGNSEALPFWVADSDYASPPEVVDALHRAVANCAFGYMAPTDSYLNSVCLWVEKRHGWAIKPEWVVPSTGVVSELANIVRCFTAPGDRILVETPVYDPFGNVVKSAGRTLVENPLRCDGRAYSIDSEDLERDLKSGVKLMIFCSPHNPVGRVWLPDEVRQVANLCQQYGALLVSDEIHWDIIMPGHSHFTAGLAGTPDNVIVLTAPSKTFNLAGLKCSNDIIPSAGLRSKLAAWKESRHIETNNGLGLVACEAAYRHGGAWADEQNEYIWGSFLHVKDYITDKLPGVIVTPLEGTYLMWLNIFNTGFDSRGAVRRMTAAGAILNDGARYGDDSFVRLNLACPRSQLESGLPAIAAALGGV